jgi:hypothetical protein
MRRMLLSLTAIALLAFSACGARRENDALTVREPMSTTNTSARLESSSVPKAAAESNKPADVSIEKVSDGGQALPENPAVERKIIRNAELTIETQNPEEAFRKVSALAESKGGFVVNSEAIQPEGEAERGRMTVSVVLRIPAAQFDPTIEEIRKIGERVMQDKRTGQDVTEEYIDLQARLQAKKALESQFLEIMKQAKNVEDALEVQRQLADVRSEIEQLEGKRRFLENQSSLSTIKVAITPPVQILGSGGGSGAKEAFRDGVNAAAAIVYFLVRVLIASLPLLLIIGLPAWLIGRYWVRRAARAKLS